MQEEVEGGVGREEEEEDEEEGDDEEDDEEGDWEVIWDGVGGGMHDGEREWRRSLAADNSCWRRSSASLWRVSLAVDFPTHLSILAVYSLMCFLASVVGTNMVRGRGLGV